MHPLQNLIASVVLLLPAVGLAAEPAAPTNFAMEMVLSEQPQPGGDVVVRCLEGCDWTERTIQCRGEQGECRAVIAGRRLDTVQTVEARQPKARPFPGSRCLGLQVITNPPGATTQRCEKTEDEDGNEISSSCYVEEVPAADSRSYVNDVVPNSPAEQAGFSPGDVIVSVNGEPIVGRMDVMKAIGGMKAGQSFDALLERDGAAITVQGRVGIHMTDDTCAVADARMLEAAATSSPKLDYGPFKLVFDVPVGHVELRCLAGCPAGASGSTCQPSPHYATDRCMMWMYQEEGGGGSSGSGSGDPRHALPEPPGQK